ncbi:MAG: preprotein translocase subunit SecG [bacterium]
MYNFILIIHILVCSGLMIIVLLQVGKGAGLASVFGARGGADETLFGGKGAGSFLAKVTTVIAIVFMVTSITLALITSKRTSESVVKMKSSVVEEKKETTTKPKETKTSKVEK